MMAAQVYNAGKQGEEKERNEKIFKTTLTGISADYRGQDNLHHYQEN